MTLSWICRSCLWLLLASVAGAQVKPPPVPPGFGPRTTASPKSEQRRPESAKPKTEPAKPPAEPAEPGAETGEPEAEAAKPRAEAGQPEAVEAKPAAPQPLPRPAPTGALNLQNADLTQVIDALCRQLRINYILDPRVQGGVILNTYGEIKDVDTRSLLDMVLRINGAAMVQVGEIYRIVPLAEGTGRTVAAEILIGNRTVRDFIEQGKAFKDIVRLIEEGGDQYGMQTFDQSLFHLWKQKRITPEVALVNASSAKDLKLRIQGLSVR